jgi:thiamine pyrophosphokinase
MKRALVFVNGELSQISRIRPRHDDLLVGVDGGTKHILSLGLTPDLIIGDLDSLPKIPPNVPLLQYPKDKNFTDTELALQFCRGREIIVYGILGRRLDHLLANILLLTKYKFTITEGNQQIILLIGPSRFNLEGKPNDLVSLIPLTDCRKVTTEGLKWRLQGSTLKTGSSQGVSNVLARKKAQIKISKGNLLIVKTNQ